MAPQQVQWGTTTLILDNEAFRRGFLAARQWYLQDIYGEDGRPPEEPQHTVELTSEEVLRLVVIPDEQGAITLMRWATRTFLNTWGIWSATWVVLLALMKRSTTGKSKPNKNFFVVR